MPRPSVLQAFLNRFPEERRIEVENKIRSAPSIRDAYRELKRLRFRGSYDSVQHWRANDARGRVENLQSSAANVAAFIASRQGAESDPIEAAMILSTKLNLLCSSLVALLQKHEWLEPSEIRLSNGQALKLLAALPSLARAASGTTLEMSRVRTMLNEKHLALATIEELKHDWEMALRADNPELIGVFEDIARVTRSRLEVDSQSLLEKYVTRNES